MAKRMRLIPVDEYDRLQHKTLSTGSKSTAILKDHFFHDNNQKATDLLNSKKIPDDIKIQLYGSLMTIIKNELNEILESPIKVKLEESNNNFQTESGNDQLSLDDSTDRITSRNTTSDSSINNSTFADIRTPISKPDLVLLRRIPLQQIDKPFRLLKFLKDFPAIISWNETGHVTFYEEEFVADSNITDLLNYTTRELKFHDPPVAINRFLRVLKMLNVPASMLSNQAKKGYVGRIEDIPETQPRSRMSGFLNWRAFLKADDPPPSTSHQRSPSLPPSMDRVTVRKRARKP